MKKISVIIPNLNGEKLLPDCLDSLGKIDRPGVEIIVVDNGSSDGSVKLIRDNYPGITVIENETNLGFAGGCNIGTGAAVGDFIVFLNNDTRVEDNWLEELEAGIDIENDIVCTSSQIKGWDKEEDVEFGGGVINYCGFGFQRSSSGGKYGPLGEPAPIPFACGCSMMISREVFRKAGMFDEDFFAFYEDVDLGWRLNIMGYTVMYRPGSMVRHHHHATAAALDEEFRYLLWTRNTLVSVFKNYDGENLSKIFPAAILLSIERMNYFMDLRKQALLRGNEKDACRYMDIASGIAGGIQWIFEHFPLLKEKRAFVQAERKRTDAEMAERFGLKLDFDDVANAREENILSAAILNYIDFSGLFDEELVSGHIVDRLNSLKKVYTETRNENIVLSDWKNEARNRMVHLKRERDDLKNYNEDLKRRNEELNNYNENLKKDNEFLEREMTEIRNSRTFKVLEVVRKIGSFLRREKNNG